MAPTRAEVQRLWWALMVPLRGIEAWLLAAHRLMLSSCLWFHTSISVNICDHAGLVGACEWCLSLTVICYPYLLFVVVVFPKYFSVSTLFTALPLAAFLHLYLLNPFCVKWASQANMLWWWGLTCYPAPVGYRPACFTGLVRHQSLWLYLAL